MCGQGEDGEEGEEDGSDCGEEDDDDAPSRPQAESGPSSGTAVCFELSMGEKLDDHGALLEYTCICAWVHAYYWAGGTGIVFSQ